MEVRGGECFNTLNKAGQIVLTAASLRSSYDVFIPRPLLHSFHYHKEKPKKFFVHMKSLGPILNELKRFFFPKVCIQNVPVMSRRHGKRLCPK